MGETSDTSTTPQGVAGVLAEFDTAEALQAAAVRMRQEGFTRWDVHSPFPIHGIEQAMGIRFTRLPWLVLAGGMAGGMAALLMQWWMNAVNYPLVISGKPFFSLPANIPITFELIVLFSALAAFGGAMGISRLPRFSHFVLCSGRFRRATTDGLFLSIAASDPKFDPSATPQWMASLGARAVEICPLAATGRGFPRALPGVLAVAAALALLPPLLIALARQEKSDKPRIHLMQDMDFQPKYKAQAYSALFPDDRAMRPPVPGTIAVGNLNADAHFYLGYRGGQTTESGRRKAESGNPQDHQSSIINHQSSIINHRSSIINPSPLIPVEQREYFTTFPPQVSANLKESMARGRQRFDIYCAACHGLVGDGKGMTPIRALERGEPFTPTSLHVAAVRAQPVGKLFNTITNGTGKMPSYASQIPVEDRWAIVLYVRALQRSQHASLEDVPAEIRPQLR
jgi:mono/diheme cytochrome c family protein